MRIILRWLHSYFYRMETSRPIATMRMLFILFINKSMREDGHTGRLWKCLKASICDLPSFIIFDNHGFSGSCMKKISLAELKEDASLSAHSVYDKNLRDHLNYTVQKKIGFFRKIGLYLFVLLVRWHLFFRILWYASVYLRVFKNVVLKFLGFILMSMPTVALFVAFRYSHGVYLLAIPCLVVPVFYLTWGIYLLRLKIMNAVEHRIQNNDYCKGINR